MNITKPINMPRGTHYGNNYFAVYSYKLKRVCHFFSNLEYLNFLTLDINPEVESFCEQPLKIEIIQDNQIKHAIFDMWVKYKDGREEFQEVKYESELFGDDEKSLRSQEQILREETWCTNNNTNFVVRTEKNIPKGRFYLQNLNIMTSRLRRYISTEDAFYNPRIVHALQENKAMTYGDLLKNKLLPINNELNHLCYLYEKGIIHIKINDRPFDLKTEVSLWEK